LPYKVFTCVLRDCDNSYSAAVIYTRMKRVNSKLSGAALITFLALTTYGEIASISGPFVHRNLQIFLIEGESQLEGRNYITLTEAMTNGSVVVKETGNVSELSIQNRSKEATVFLNAGDIVKGGRQDRTLRDDVILETKSGSVPLASFCVENGRWTKRGSEDAAAFSANSKILPSRKLKLATRYGQDQSEVWSSVAEQQSKLNDNLSRLSKKRVETRDAVSASSLQLTLENRELEKIQKEYLDELQPLLKGKNDVLGFAYAINGELNTAEVYNNRKLFRALWPKLLDSAITEAVAEHDNDRAFSPIPSSEVQKFCETALSGAVESGPVTKSKATRTLTTSTTILFETCDPQADGVWLHRTIMKKAPGETRSRSR
jgi:hypothetical protein